jgi:hypothetical protein
VKRLLLTFPLLALACSDVTPPAGVLLSCTTDDECPGEQVCEPTTSLCVPPGSGEELAVLESAVDPVVIGGPFVDADGLLTVDFTLSAAPLSAPTVQLLDETQAELESADAEDLGDNAYRATFATSRDLDDGRLFLFAEAVDDRGVPRRFPLGDARVDLTPPGLVGAAIIRLPDPQRTPVALDIAGASGPVGPAVDVRVTFSADEPIQLEGEDAPALLLEGGALTLARDENIANPFFFDLVWPEPAPELDATLALTARVVDLAGNVTEAVLADDLGDLALDVDTLGPALPDVDTPERVVFERAPWGRSEAGELDVFTVRGEAGAVEPGAFVLVTRDPEGERELGRIIADDAGAFGGVDALRLATGDLREVFLVVVDGAGNAAPAVRVLDAVWVASPGGKIAGDIASNPHVFEALPVFTRRLAQGGAVELDADDGLGALDDALAVSLGAGTWQRLASDESDPLSPEGSGVANDNPVLVDPAFGHDPVRGLSVVFGGSVSVFTEPSVSNAFCRGAVDDMWLRGADDRFRRFTPELGDARPGSMRAARFAFDSKQNLLMLTGRNDSGIGEMWSFDGERFTQLCTDAACAASLPGNMERHGFVFDPVRGQLVMHIGSFEQRTLTFDGETWTTVCGPPDDPNVPGVPHPLCATNDDRDGAMVFDSGRGQPVWFDGQGLFAFDGVNWTELCTDDCAAGAPPVRDEAQIAYDPVRARIVMFGGQVESGACSFDTQFGRPPPPTVPPPPQPFGDTWEFDGTAWTEVTPTTSPPSRGSHVMGWDETRGRVVVSGGDDCNCYQDFAGGTFRPGWDEDFWEYDGTTWVRVDQAPAVPSGYTAEDAPALRDHRMTAAPDLEGVVLYGDGAGDSNLHLLRQGRFYRSAVESTEIGRLYPGLATSADGTQVFAVGGGSASDSGGGPTGAPFSHVVVGNDIVPACDGDPSCGAPVIAPAPPLLHGMAHDGTQLVLVGGFNVGSGGGFGFSLSSLADDQVWTWDPTSGFIERCLASSCTNVPPRRIRTQLARTGVPGEVLLFGGFPLDARTWTFSDLDWTIESPAESPLQRADHVLVYDEGRDAVFLTSGTNFEFSNDSRGSDFQQALSTELDIVWEWRGGEWHRARESDPEGDGRPASRYGAAGAWEPVTGGVILHGGTPPPEIMLGGAANGSTTRLDDVWRWRGGEDTQPAQRFRVSTRAAGLFPEQRVQRAELRWFTSDAPDLLIWDGGGWRALSSTSCGAGCHAATLDGDLVRSATQGDFAEVVVALLGDFNPSAPDYAEVSTDFVELRLVYR